MANRYVGEVADRAIRLRREWIRDSTRFPTRGGGGTNAGQAGPSTVGRVQAVWSERSRRTMRWLFAGLPWELLGERPVMLTLTYPAEWRDCVPDARTLARHRKALEAWWRRHFGAPIGVWVVEFQPRDRRPLRQRNAPHVHVYIGLPECVSDDEYRRLVGRKIRGEWLERRFGRYEGRRRLGPIEGEFSQALLLAWARIVGSGDRRHLKRGVDLRPAFGNREVAAVADRGKVADYFWRESGKWAQKAPPEDFGSLNFYGRWGSHVGFNLAISEAELEEATAMELRRMLLRLAAGKQRAIAQKQRLKPRKFNAPRGRDGLTVFDVEDAEEVFVRLARCAEESVRWKLSGALPRPRRRARAQRRWEEREERRWWLANEERVAEYEAEERAYEAYIEERAREASGW